MSTDPLSTPRSRRPFYWVVLLFCVPLIAAFIIYYGMSWRPGGMTNKGQLISPPIALPEVALPTSAGDTTAAQFLTGKWTFLYAGAGECARPCRDALFVTRQVRLLLGKDMQRVQRVFLYSGACCDEGYFGKEQQGLMRVAVDNAPGEQLLGVFPRFNAVPPLQAGRIYLIDPLGNLMMSYAPHADARDLLSDIKKLLSLSHIG